MAAPLEIEEHTHAGMAAAYAAGAARLPFGVLRRYEGTELAANTRVARVTCPFTGDVVTAVPALNLYWLQAGRIDLGFLGAAQIDRFANLNSTVIGEYEHPTTRLPGAGGAPEIAAWCRETFVLIRHFRRTFVERLDFRSTVGNGDGPGSRDRLGFTGRGLTVVVTDLGVLAPYETGELSLCELHPGVTVDAVRGATGWNVRVANDLSVAEPPTEAELAVLRRLANPG